MYRELISKAFAYAINQREIEIKEQGEKRYAYMICDRLYHHAEKYLKMFHDGRCRLYILSDNGNDDCSVRYKGQKYWVDYNYTKKCYEITKCFI